MKLEVVKSCGAAEGIVDSLQCSRKVEFLPFTKKSGRFGWTVNGKAILVCLTGKYPK